MPMGGSEPVSRQFGTRCHSGATAVDMYGIILGNNSKKLMAEVHGNRTHLPPSADGTPDLKSGGPTSEPRTSAAPLSSDVSGSAADCRAFRRHPTIIINPVTEKDNPVPGPAGGERGRARSHTELRSKSYFL